MGSSHKYLSLLVLFFCSDFVRSQALICYESGVCDRGYFLNNTKTAAADKCHAACSQTIVTGKPCKYWTYSSKSTECFMYAADNGCNLVPSTAFPDSVTGDVLCPLQYICDWNVKCTGTLNGPDTSVTGPEDCLAECQNQAETDCTWYSYDSNGNVCLFFEECASPPSCATCTTGQRECQETDFVMEYNKLWLTTGFNSTNVMSEVLDVNQPTRYTSCPRPGDYSLHVSGSGGGFINERPVLCGGFIGADYESPTSKCYEFNVNDGTNDADNGKGRWIEMSGLGLSTPRAEMAVVQKSQTEWWFTGGFTTEYTDMTEIYRTSGSNEVLQAGPDLPRSSAEHCIVRLGSSSTAFLMVGGIPGTVDTHIYDFGLQNPAWRKVAPTKEAKRGPFCGLIKRSDDSLHVVIAAGVLGGRTQSSYIYSVADDVWDDGPRYPLAASNGISVQYGNSFLTTGGDLNVMSTFANSIFTYNTNANRFDELVGLRTSLVRSQGVGFLIADYFYLCDGEPTTNTITGETDTIDGEDSPQGSRQALVRSEGHLLLAKRKLAGDADDEEEAVF